MKMRTWMAALVMGCAGMTVEAQTPTTDVDVAVLGHNLGDKFTRHHQSGGRHENLAEARPHWQLEEYGSTTEGRPPAGARHVLRREHGQPGCVARGQPTSGRGGVDSGDRVVWVYLSYNVHGNEAVCTEAAMATAEALATTHSHLLEKAVVVMDPVSTRTARPVCAFQDQSTSPVPTPTRTLGNTTSRGLAVDPTTTCLT